MLEALLEADAVDRYRAVTKTDDAVLIPIQHPEPARAACTAPLVEASVEPNPRRAPAQQVRDALRGVIPDRWIGAVPDGYDEIGDVLMLRLPDVLSPHAEAVGRAFGEVLDAASVLALEGTHGHLREPDTRLLWGEPDTRTVHREAGIVYHLDPAKVLFSVGNHHERHRLTDRITTGEHVVDLFAGIGYFTLPIAKAGARVTACELNPTSAAFLRENIEANTVADRVEVREGDCRETGPTGVADRVLMGYFPGTDAYLATALDALKPEGGTIHYHTVADAADPIGSAFDEIARHPSMDGARIARWTGRRVKTVGPQRVHVALDAEARPADPRPEEAPA